MSKFVPRTLIRLLLRRIHLQQFYATSCSNCTPPSMAAAPKGGRPRRGDSLPASSFKLQASGFLLQASSFLLPASSFLLPASSFRLQASSFLLRASSLQLRILGTKHQFPVEYIVPISSLSFHCGNIITMNKSKITWSYKKCTRTKL